MNNCGTVHSIHSKCAGCEYIDRLQAKLTRTQAAYAHLKNQMMSMFHDTNDAELETWIPEAIKEAQEILDGK